MKFIILGICGIFLCLLGESLCFSAGQTYQYKYRTSVRIDRPNLNTTISKKSGTVHVDAVVEISTLWERDGDYLMRLKFLEAYASRRTKSTKQAAPQLLKQPIFFSRRLGGNTIIHRLLDDGLESVNIKQGLINLLQYQMQPGTLKELDISGECDVTYGREGDYITKTKHNCQPRQLTGHFSNPQTMLSLSMKSSYVMKYKIDDMLVLREARCEETHTGATLMDRRIGSTIMQTQDLVLLKDFPGDRIDAADIDLTLAQIRKGIDDKLFPTLLSSEPERGHCDSQVLQEARAVVAKYRDDLHPANAALPEQTTAFLHVVNALRQTNEIAILEILHDPDNYDIVNEIMDACVAADTNEAQEALQDYLVFDNEDEYDVQERFLFGTAFTTHPSQDNIIRLKNLVSKGIPNIKLRTSMLLSLGSILNTYYRRVNRYTLSFVTDTQNWLLTRLNECEDDDCKAMYLGALRNAALPGTLPTILYYAEHAEVERVNLAALDALDRFGEEILTKEGKDTLLRIYYETEQQQPLPVRIAAIDNLLRTKMTARELRDVISSTTWLPSNESTAYVNKRILHEARNNAYYRHLLNKLRKQGFGYYYDTNLFNGTSVAMTSPLIVSSEVSSTYSLFMENTASGLLQKSITDVIAATNDHVTLPIMRVGIHADGLDSVASYFGGEDSTTSKEPSAGLKLSLLGVGLRPIQFFNSQSEMMTAMWNAPSEPVSALQGSILLHDHSQLLSLTNGLTVDVQVHSALSLDLSGAVSLSIWNRQAQSAVRNSGSFVLHGDTHIHSALFSVGINYTAEVTGEMVFSSDVDFSDVPIAMCMQMTMPDYDYSLRITRRASIPNQKPFRVNHQHTQNHPGHTFLLDTRNTQHCNKMEKNR